MIRILIIADGDKVYDEFQASNTNLAENSLCMRKLEEIKETLLQMEYENDIDIQHEEIEDE